ncbi:MAG: Uma2 family endonuclease [Thermomicrobiales bacterium]|nr:Uma2 family endonuclease [Thermomicrobiales bacterium]
MVAQPVEQTPADLAPAEEHTLSIREQRVLLDNVSWDLFERILVEDVDRRVPRLAYDDGALEFMTPSRLHESIDRTLTSLAAILIDVWRMDLIECGAMTMSRAVANVGLEPDSSFFIQHAAEARRNRDSVFPEGFPPDLVIEVEISRSLVERLPLLAAMGVPEVWRATSDTVAILTLSGHEYRHAPSSAALPGLTPEKLQEFMTLSQNVTRSQWADAVRTWAAAIRT